MVYIVKTRRFCIVTACFARDTSFNMAIKCAYFCNSLTKCLKLQSMILFLIYSAHCILNINILYSIKPM